MTILRDHINQFVAVNNDAVFINHQDTIPVAIKSHAKIGLFGQHRCLQWAHVGRAALMINVKTVGFDTHGNRAGSQFFKYLWCGVIGGAMSTI